MGVHGSAVSFCNPGQPYPRAPGLGSSVKWGEEIPRYSNLKSPLGGMNRCRGGVWFLGQVHGRWFPACGCSVSPAGQGLAGGSPRLQAGHYAMLLVEQGVLWVLPMLWLVLLLSEEAGAATATTGSRLLGPRV